ncbi:hypothetical protein BU23DRAFT_533941 [Bimuria novae-zelandiae CBS 107.79]|uniref:SURP motif domain-containing protein n=1 Tax=Bimuria novae-zelandiae CBS 107.79 TaxID=1447943 RepID=A0A6A5VAL5_9PLEO|nr:hypothetical protein BU23DRAFT_533941 [Bimuria novae-zelandiae CBS 107.79]
MAVSNGESGDLAVNPPPEVIIPPKHVRDKIVKAADFVHRRSEREEAAMVARVRENSNTAMAFVLPEDPYNPYYTWFLQQLREGKGPAAAKAQVVTETKPQGPPEPPKFRFSARMPQINAKDLEILRLTALYTARVGENWLKELRNRESGNAQFEFLRPTHSFFPFFRALVEQYKILLEEEQTVEARKDELRRNIQNRFHVLDRAKERAEYVKYVTQQKEKEEKKAEDEKKEYAAIDWHEFGVIATILFDEGDDAADLPPPQNLTDLQSASLEQKAMVSLSTKRIEEAMPDEVPYYNSSQQPVMPPLGYPGMPPVAPAVQPAYTPPSAPPYGYQPAALVDWQADAARQAREQQAERDQVARAQAATRGTSNTMKIRTDYVPRGKKANVSTVQCPNCKQQFPADEIEEHIRIELLDPRWKEQRAKAEARYSTVITPNEAANNLKRFASQRDDIYDDATGMPITEEEAARRKKAATSYDGQPDPAKDAARLQQMQTMNVQEQLRRIQERHGGGQ